MHYSPTPCIWQLFLGVWVLLVEYGTLDFSGDDFVRGAMLGLTLDTGLATVLGFWKNFTYFLRRRGLGFWRFFSCRMRSMLSRCFDLSPCTRGSPLEYRHHFYELTSWILCDDVGHFFVLSAHFSDSPDRG